MSKKALYKNFQLQRIVLFILLAFVYMIVFTYHGKPIVTNAIDGTFHMSRILSLENIWQSPVNFKFFNHNGPVVNLFYPWLMVYPMYFFMHLSKSIIGGYYIYGILLAYATLEIAYWSSKKITKKDNVSVIFAIFYTFALVRTVNLYCRFALGEVVAMTFLPLVLLGIYQVFYAKKPKYLSLVIGMTAIVYTHMISFYISCVFVGLFLIIRLIERSVTKERWIALLKAIGLTILFTLSFFIPMLQIYATTKIEPPLMYNLMDTATTVPEIILGSINNHVDGMDVLGIVCLVLFIFAIIKYKKLNRFLKDNLIVGIISLVLCTKLFPWILVQPLFQVVQFPWRFLVLTTLVACFAGSVALVDTLKDKQVTKVLVAIMIAVIVLHLGTIFDARGSKDNPGYGDKTYIHDMTTKVAQFNGAGDYRPQKTNNDYEELLQRHVKVGKEWQKPAKIKYTNNEIAFTVKNENNAKKAILPVWVYPGEKVIHDGKVIEAKASYNGSTLVPIHKGTNKYKISYHYTTLAKSSFVITIVSMIGFGCYYIFRRNK